MNQLVPYLELVNFTVLIVLEILHVFFELFAFGFGLFLAGLSLLDCVLELYNYLLQSVDLRINL